MTQRTRSGAALVVRAEGDALQLIAPIRAALRSRDPNLPLSNVRSMEAVLSASLAMALPHRTWQRSPWWRSC